MSYIEPREVDHENGVTDFEELNLPEVPTSSSVQTKSLRQPDDIYRNTELFKTYKMFINATANGFSYHSAMPVHDSLTAFPERTNAFYDVKFSAYPYFSSV